MYVIYPAEDLISLLLGDHPPPRSPSTPTQPQAVSFDFDDNELTSRRSSQASTITENLVPPTPPPRRLLPSSDPSATATNSKEVKKNPPKRSLSFLQPIKEKVSQVSHLHKVSPGESGSPNPNSPNLSGNTTSNNPPRYSKFPGLPKIAFTEPEEDFTFTNYREKNTTAGNNSRKLALLPPTPTTAGSSSGGKDQDSYFHFGSSSVSAAGGPISSGVNPVSFPRRSASPAVRATSTPPTSIKSPTPPPRPPPKSSTPPGPPPKSSTPPGPSTSSANPFTFNLTRPGGSTTSLNMAGINGPGGGAGIGSAIGLSGGQMQLPPGIPPGNIIEANSFKDLVHPSLNETLKCHNALSFKLIRIVSDFTSQLSQLHEQHSVELQGLVEDFRKRNAELRKEKPPCNNSLFQIWESLLQEVEMDSQAHSDISGSLGRQVARPLLEKTFCLKIQSRKAFAHRESFETVLSKTETLLANTYRDYSDACLEHIQQGSNTTLSQYYDAHNTYVQQLRGTNAMLKEYHSETLPALLVELEEIYTDLCMMLSESVLHGTDIISNKTTETNRRYETLAAVCRNINGTQDLRELVKTMIVPAAQTQRHDFTLPLPLLQEGDMPNLDLSHVPVLKDEIILDRLSAMSARSRLESLKKEMVELESEIKSLQDSLDTLIRIQLRSLDSNLFNKANELQEEISMKRFDLRVAQMHLAALKAQREMFIPTKPDSISPGGSKFASSSNDPNKDRKMSMAATNTMKSKWLNAFRSLKSTPANEPSPAKEEPPKKNGKDKDNKEAFQIFENHIFQEYTYKKITPCDICSQILRGHTRQGLRCRMCKMNVHADCQEKVGKCQPKTRLLRRQRSTSELETRLTQLAEPPEEEMKSATLLPGATPPHKQPGDDQFDMTYQVLKEATVLKKPGGSSSGSGSGNGIHGSSQTLHSQHELTPSRIGRSNPSVNIVPGNSGSSTNAHSGPSTPGAGGSLAAQILGAQPSSSGTRGPQVSQRRDSYMNRKCISADAEGSSNPAALHFPPPRSISLTASPTPHSPRRRKLDLRMKSFSLDSPESTEHAQRRRYAHGSHSTSHSQYLRSGQYANGNGHGIGMVHSSSASNNANNVNASPSSSSDFYSSQSQTQSPYASLNHFAPSSPVHNRRTLLSARNVRMSSVELPDENDKSLSSASTSPCPSPQKPHRLLPTNLYVVLYMFKARHPDELDLKAGYKVTVIDTTDPDWWQGKCMGRIGYFPSKYVTKLHPGEKPLQVTHNLQVTDGAENGLKLLRDQIVIQIGEELDGMVTIRNGENKQGVCPLKYLQEI